MKRKVLSFLKKNYWLFLCFCFFFFFLLIAHVILKEEMLEFDRVIYNYINSFFSDDMTIFFELITNLASGYILIGMCLLTFLFVKKKRFFYFMSFNFINTVVFNQILKLIFARERPLGIAIIDEFGYSFPSGHSMTAMSFYGLLIYLTFCSGLNKCYKVFIITCLCLLILLIGISRIYLGVHYASDVIGGFCISISYLILFTRVIDDYLWEVRENEQ